MGDVKLAKEVDAFIRRWQGREGSQERANYVSFHATLEQNDYVFERAVGTHKDHAAGSTSTKKQLCS